MSGEVLGGVVVAAEDVEVVPIDLDISSNREVSWSDEFIVFVNVLVLGSLQEWSFDDT